MRDDSVDSVTSGGQPAPLGARAGGPLEASGDGGVGMRPGGRIGTPSIGALGASTTMLLVVLATSLVGYSAVAADVVNAGRLSEIDLDIAMWVAGSMPTWAEWLAWPFTWLGGAIGITTVVTVTIVWLLTRRALVEASLLLVVVVGIQTLVFTRKDAYARPRPHVGNAIPLPSSYSFPSGHAATGIAVFGLLGIFASTIVQGRRKRIVVLLAGFALGALIGASRIVLGVHYTTDVLAGSFLGLAWLLACVLVACSIDRRRRASG